MTGARTAALPLRFIAGRRVAEHIRREGFRLTDFPTLLGAAGGPKWLVLHGLDRVLAPKLALAGPRFELIGASIGSWRFAAYAQQDPAAALDRLLESYTRFDVFQQGPIDMDAVFDGYCRDLLGASGVEEVLASPHAALHVVVAWLRRRWLPPLAGLGFAASVNAFGRRAMLRLGPERVLFSTSERAGNPAFKARQVMLTAANLAAALRASGAIPGFVSPVADLVPGERGVGVDGGIIDYHFDGALAAEDFVLYPHFYPHLVPGWFDKPFRRRRIDPTAVDNLLVLAPSADFVARLPGAKLPDRNDPRRLGLEACRDVWCQVADASRQLGDAFGEAFESNRIPQLIETP